MSGLHPDMPIHQRVSVISDALAKVLDRAPLMEVEGTGNGEGLFVWVRGPGEGRMDSSIYIEDLARELEVLL